MGQLAATFRILEYDLAQQSAQDPLVGFGQRLQHLLHATNDFREDGPKSPPAAGGGLDVHAPSIHAIPAPCDVALFLELVEKPRDTGRVLGERCGNLGLGLPTRAHQVCKHLPGQHRFPGLFEAARRVRPDHPSCFGDEHA
jgi:hypothetical protein